MNVKCAHLVNFPTWVVILLFAHQIPLQSLLHLVNAYCVQLVQSQVLQAVAYFVHLELSLLMAVLANHALLVSSLWLRV